MSAVTTADSAARADWIGCALNARTSVIPRMRKVDMATPFRFPNERGITGVTDRVQIAGDDFVERRSFRAGDLDNAVSRRRECHIGNDGGNVVRRDGLEQAGRK